MKKPMIGIQLYTLRDECARDFEGTLRKVAAMGYDGVELAGFHGWEVAKLKTLLDELGLRVVASLIGLNELVHSFDDHRKLGCDYIVVPYIQPQVFQRKEQVDRLIGQLSDAAAACKEANIKLGYHNHDFEITNQYNGKPALFEIFERLGKDELLVEFDVYWLRKGGLNNTDTLQRYSGRMPTIHLKDMTEDGRFAPVGQGVMDFGAICRAAEAANVEWFVVEQDDHFELPPLESVEKSINYLRDNLNYTKYRERT